MSDKTFFVTTPIYYINDVPHIGHAYATFAADILIRYHRILGEKTLLLTGSDENSQKTVESAQKKGLEVNEYAKTMAENWQSAWEKLAVADGQFTFVRTTDPEHEKFVQKIFQKLYDQKYIYLDTYKGLYCVGHEAFLRPEDLDEQGNCPDHKTKPQELQEKNYFFKLSSFADKLKEHIAKNPDFVQPETRRHEIQSFLELGLQDISISRENAKWGIKVPFDENHRIYVWFDALLSYYSQTPTEFWQNGADVQIIGKDILRFHTVIWPAILWAADLPLPKRIFAHGFFTIDGQKISKSLGNTVDPLAIASEYGTDALRYFLFKEIPFGSDGDFSFDKFKEVYNADLANGLGNLVSRVTKLAESLNLESDFSTKKPSLEIALQAHLGVLNFQAALVYIWDKIRAADKRLEQTRPWDLVKSNPEKAANEVENLVRQLHEIQELITPFLPGTARKIKVQFAGKIKSAAPLFPRK